MLRRIIIMLLSATVLALCCPVSVLVADDNRVELHDSENAFSKEGEKVYDDIKRDGKDSVQRLIDSANGATGDDIIGDDYIKKVWVWTFYVYDFIAGVYYIGIILLMSVGVLIALLSTKNKKRRRFAIWVLIIGIPAVLTVIKFGTPYLYIYLTR